MKLTKYHQEHRVPDTLFILLLLCLFAACSLFFAVLGADAYNEINQRRETTFQRSTPLSYLATKVRQADSPQAVRMEEKDGVTALVLSEEDGGELLETWVYEYDGFLWEICISPDTQFALSDGTALLESRGLAFTLEQELGQPKTLTLSVEDEEGLPSRLTQVLRGDNHE